MGKRMWKVDPDDLIGPLNDVEKKFSPESLYCKGKLDLIRKGPRVAIIGTRKPSPRGIEHARKITEFLVKNGVVIVSGLALGIDSVAHNTAIDRGGSTIAVLGTPLDRHYPKANSELQELIGAEHLLVSQFPSDAPVQRQNFPMRNRTMALLSNASIIVEVGKTSGTIHQGWEALRLGRPLFIHTDIVNNPDPDWPKNLMEYGAVELGDKNFNDILEVLPGQVVMGHALF